MFADVEQVEPRTEQTLSNSSPYKFQTLALLASGSVSKSSEKHYHAKIFDRATNSVGLQKIKVL